MRDRIWYLLKNVEYASRYEAWNNSYLTLQMINYQGSLATAGVVFLLLLRIVLLPLCIAR
jgi:hypothetical protein